MSLKIACVIPALNEEASVAEVVAGCRAECLAVYVVDDGSSDATGKVSREAGAEVIVHETNLGKGKSLEDGMARAHLAPPCRGGQKRPLHGDS